MEKDKNFLVLVLIGFAFLFLFGNFGMGGYGMMGFGMGFGFLFMLLFWGVLICLVVTFIKSSQSGKMEEDLSKILKNEVCVRRNLQEAISRNEKAA